MRYTKIIAATLASGAILSVSAMSANAGYRTSYDQFRVVGLDGGSTLSMHVRPSNYSRTITRLPFNARYVTKIRGGHDGRWVRVRYNGRSGWVLRRRLASDNGGRVFYRVTGLGRNGRLDIHARPRHNASVRGTIHNNARFIVNLGICSGNWCKVSFNGVRGWVEKHCLISMRRTQPSYRRDRYRNWRNDRITRYRNRGYRSYDRARRWSNANRSRRYQNINTLAYDY